MKVLLLSLVCVVGRACAGAVAWPGAVAVAAPGYSLSTIPHTKGFAYSTTQYINTLPQPYSFGVYPQYSYQIPQQSAISPIQHAYYPAPSTVYYPGSIYYPGVSPIASIIPGSPQAPISGIPQNPETIPAQPGFPESSSPIPSPQPQGDSDSAVIESADSSPQQLPSSEPANQAAQFPSTFPSFPQIPQDFPSFPQFPQESGAISNLPQLPQQPQIPQFPGFPQSPGNPSAQNPATAPPSSFPSVGNQDQGLNDEDSISVESA